MPLDGATFYQRGQNSSHTMVASYYLETISGGKYELDHQDTVYGKGDSVTKEDRYSITGFTLNEGKSTRIGRDYNGAKFYYNRNSYNIVFMNNGAKDSDVSRKYQQDISDVTYTPTRPAGVPANFTFAGWYDNELCEGTAYDFTGKTMPAQNITLYAKWQAPVIKATVYLTASADGEFETIEIPYGTKLSDSEDFKALLEKLTEKPSAWIDSNGALFNVDTNLHGSVTISPFFPSAKDGFTVTYVEGTNVNVATDNQKYVSGSSARVLPPEASENFLAWKTEDGTLIHPGDKITVTKNTTLTAVYTNKPQTETITYHYNFGDSTKTFTDSGYPKNTTATVKSLEGVGFTAPTGYEFLGWATAQDSNKIEYAAGAPVFVDATGDNNLYAVWQVKTYTIKWVNWDDSEVRTDTEVPYGTELKAPEDPTREADAEYTYTFASWTPEIETVTGNATYKATYTKEANTYTLTYDLDGGEWENDTTYTYPKKYNEEVEVKADPTKEGYTFAGWTSAEVKVENGKFTMPAKNVTLTAKWNINKYTVTWKNDDGSVLRTDKNVEYGTMPNYGANPTKAADAQYTYTFKGWTPEVSKVTGNAVYTAVYEKTTNKYTVTWKNDDGSVLRTDKNVEYGTMPNYGANPTKAADAQYTYTFKGWTPEVETVTGDATYKATYTKEANTYTLTYDLDGGEWENDTTYTYPKKYNEEVEVKADPTKEGYTFVGWMSAEVEVVNGKFTMPAKDVTLKAQWKANIYNVTYDLDGGEWTEATNEFPYEYKATVEVVKTVPTREGYKFSGWRSEEITIENDAFTMPAKDVVLKAVWEANPTPTPIPSEEPTPTPTPTPAPTEEPTPTPAPTEEPTPTPAPTEEPTPTPAPTEEPTPTPAPTEEPTPTPAPTEESTPTPAPNPNPNPATPTPAPVAPVVPATVATPTPTPTATPSATPSDNGGKGDGNNDGEIGETINDNDTPLANGEDIADNATPLAGLGTGAWALINLILTIVTTLLSILLLIGYIGKKKKALEDEDGNVVLDENGKEVMEYEKNKKGLWRLISIIPALIAIIVFIFTEDMTLPMIFVDKWTILHAVIALVQVVVMVLCKKKKDENDEDENAANA